MSTAYPPRLVRYAFSSKKERQAARSSPMTPGSYGDFPDTVSLYYSKEGTDFLSQHFELGPPQPPGSEQPRQVLYAVTFHKAPGGGQMTLYSSSQHGGSPIAIGVSEKRFSSSATLTLPGEAGSKGASKTEQLKQSGFATNAKHTFTFAGEIFEWREDKSRKPTVRTLIRPGAASSTNAGAEQDEGSSKAASLDEGQLIKPPTTRPDVIATWTEGTVPNRQGMLGGLKFSDHGVAAQLGGYFKLLAVSSVLVICQYGGAVDGTASWAQEKRLEKSYQPK